MSDYGIAAPENGHFACINGSVAVIPGGIVVAVTSSLDVAASDVLDNPACSLCFRA